MKSQRNWRGKYAQELRCSKISNGFDHETAVCQSGEVLAQYLPEGSYRFSMAFSRGTFADFYRASENNEKILRERKRWLADDPGKYVAVAPGAEGLLREAAELGVEQGTLLEAPPTGLEAEPMARFIGERWEPDYLLLRRDESGMRLMCGCVCFPSFWALEEKIGCPMEEIHGVVPSLNEAIGRQIRTFLEKLKPCVAWMRSNWGLCRSAELNQHPSRRTPRLDGNVRLDEVYFRVEEQSLVALPESGGILFGIRVKVLPLGEYAATDDGRRLAQALETMPEEMAVYKGLAQARSRIIELLKG